MIGLTAGVVGLIVGVGFGGTDVETIERDAQASADERIDEVEDEAAKEVRLLRGELDEQIDSAVTDAVDEAVAEEKAKRSRLIKKAVTKAVDETTSEMEAQQLVSQPETVEDSTDPQFDTCGAANAAGYGNYREGADPEYDWYQDRDNDGVVCE
ncbi:excalibur calcium-binding domain-containing protein [Aeromicrobium sp. CF4.19]|uniref:excalibur calcium-binding domain-containing protein n=1 Tax=Aeromicrobium sp. CF4.19 TaxID=3373082 RepID=UPI003EE524FA